MSEYDDGANGAVKERAIDGAPPLIDYASESAHAVLADMLASHKRAAVLAFPLSYASALAPREEARVCVQARVHGQETAPLVWNDVAELNNILTVDPVLCALHAAIASLCESAHTRLVYGLALVHDAQECLVWARFTYCVGERGPATTSEWLRPLQACADAEYGHLREPPLVFAEIRVLVQRETCESPRELFRLALSVERAQLLRPSDAWLLETGARIYDALKRVPALRRRVQVVVDDPKYNPDGEGIVSDADGEQLRVCLRLVHTQ